MFGRKQSATRTGDFRCGVCGTRCLDQYSFERHAQSAHQRAETPKISSMENLKGSDQKA